MRRIACVIGIVLFSAPLVGQQRRTTYEQVTVDSTAGGVAIAVATLSGMAGCQGVLETAQIRYRYDGGAPTTTVGTPVEAGGVIAFDHISDARAARFIRTTGTSGTLNISCWPQP